MRRFAVELGPPIPAVPITAFSRLNVTEDEMAKMWQIVGPSVERNMRLPLWKIICAAYIEGLNHGHGIASGQAVDSHAA